MKVEYIQVYKNSELRLNLKKNPNEMRGWLSLKKISEFYANIPPFLYIFCNQLEPQSEIARQSINQKDKNYLKFIFFNMIFKQAKKGDQQKDNASKVTGAKLRLQNDIAEYNADKIKSIDIKFPNEKNIMEMLILVSPTNETLYHGATYTFSLDFPANYPLKAPKLELKHKIFHPNFDYEGHVCLPLVRDDWMPINTLYDIICGLIYLFGSPNPKDPLNPEAGALMNDNYEEFKKVVKETLRGGKYKNESFDKMIK